LIFANQQPPLQPDVFTGTTVTLSFGHRSPHFEQTARSMKAWTRQFSPSRAVVKGPTPPQDSVRLEFAELWR
jgi:hypothetical protein